MRAVRASLALFAAFAVVAGSARASAGVSVLGKDQARIELPAGVEVAAYENVGYRLSLAAGPTRVRVEVELEPLESSAPFRLPAVAREDTTSPSVHRLARALTADSRTVYSAVSRVLDWVSRNIEYELDRSTSQEPNAVLERRSAYCTGAARLAVALLDAIGVEAREVPGYLVDESTAGGRFHRWIEVHYPDRGWAFSDPLASHHYVSASYVRLGGERIAEPAHADSVGGRLLERRDQVQVVDVYPDGPPGIRGRKNESRQRAAALRVEVAGHESGFAVLEGAGVRHTNALVGGSGTFVGLEPGRYRLSLVVAGRRVERVVNLPGHVRAAVYLPSGATH